MQPDVAVVVLAQRLGILLLVVDITQHHRRAGEANLALFAIGQLVVGARLANLVVGIGVRDTDAPLLLFVVRSQAAGGDALGGAVTLAHPHARIVLGEELVKLLLEFDGERVAPREHTAKATQVGAVEIFVAGDSLEQRGHARNHVGAGLLYQVSVALNVETRHQYRGTAHHHHGVDAYSQAKTVEHRHRRQHLGVVGLKIGHRTGLLSQRVEVQIGEHDALGGTGRTAREEHHRLAAEVLLRYISFFDRFGPL